MLLPYIPALCCRVPWRTPTVRVEPRLARGPLDRRPRGRLCPLGGDRRAVAAAPLLVPRTAGTESPLSSVLSGDPRRRLVRRAWTRRAGDGHLVAGGDVLSPAPRRLRRRRPGRSGVAGGVRGHRPGDRLAESSAAARGRSPARDRGDGHRPGRAARRHPQHHRRRHHRHRREGHDRSLQPRRAAAVRLPGA